MQQFSSTEQTFHQVHHQKAFEARFTELRKQFDERRAETAAIELTKNRFRVDRLLKPLRQISCHGICNEDSIRTVLPAGHGVRLRLTGSNGTRSDRRSYRHPRVREEYEIPVAFRIPNYSSWSFITDSQQHRKVPTKKKLFYTDELGEAVPATDDDSDDAPTSYHSWTGKDIEWREFCFKAIVSEFGSSRAFPNLLSRCLCVDLQAVEMRLEEDRRPSTSMEYHTRLLCRRCLSYTCLRHPKSNTIPSFQPKIIERAPTNKPCGEHCWKLNRERNETGSNVSEGRFPLETESETSKLSQQNESSSHFESVAGLSVDPAEIDGWTLDELLLLDKGIDIYGDDSCLLGRYLWTKKCWEIFNYLSKSHNMGARRNARTRKRRKLSKKISVGRKGAPVITKRLHHNEMELWHQYIPCSCKNGCSASCPCVTSKNFCDKYCACWTGPRSQRRLCNNAWKGCKCAQRCDTQRCPCVAAARECDPDVCGNCRETCGPNCPEEFSCKNMSIRLRHHKRVAMGLSEIVGWGTFMLQDAKKDELVGEYTGELISDDEAERRGRIYDMEDKSYLFSATTETVIDANHRGNKLRFANHSTEPNCYVKYLLVDGDYRVGIFAGRDIAVGEELLYDYGTSFFSNWNEEVEKTASFPTKTAARRT